MPSKYTVRSFTKDGYYHVYNIGIDKKQIFQDTEDYNTFYYYLYIYLAPLERSARKYKEIPLRLAHKNLHAEITLFSYCLMPDHFHLLLQQKSINGVTKLLKQLTNAYTQYYNQKYRRSGPLFAGRYKAVQLKNSEEITQLTRHIHLHPVQAGLNTTPDYEWSSYSEYADPSPRNLCTTKPILERFPSIYMYKKFVMDQKDYQKKLSRLGILLFDDK